MNRILYIFIFSTLVLTTSCGNKNSQNDKMTTKDTSLTDVVSDSALRHENNSENKESDNSTTTIKFEELTLEINKFVAYDKENILSIIQKDTVIILADLGETIEKQNIKIETSLLENVKVEQSYETSITIMDEGPHCDLTEWKHFTSEWKSLDKINSLYKCLSYSEKETEKFPQTTIEELKAEVKSKCGDKWAKHIENVTSLTEYPCGIGISRYFLRITGQFKTNGTKISKLIVIENPMGC